MDFYDGIAQQYDEIVDSASRRQAADRLAAHLVKHYGTSKALDAACGTGLFARALAAAGATVTAGDISGGMLDQARKLSEKTCENITWVHAPMQELAAHVTGPFDTILCMGNSLPHLLTDDELKATLEGFRALLAGGGVAMIQILNYERVISERQRIVGVSRHGDSQHIRFYDFLPGRVRFNILELTWDGDKCSHELHETTLRPYTAAQLTVALEQAGFAKVELYAGLDLQTPFDADSDQLVLLARG